MSIDPPFPSWSSLQRTSVCSLFLLVVSCSGKGAPHDRPLEHDAMEPVETDFPPVSLDDASPGYAASPPLSDPAMDASGPASHVQDAGADAAPSSSERADTEMMDSSIADSSIDAQQPHDASDGADSSDAEQPPHDGAQDGAVAADAAPPDAGFACTERTPEYLAALEWAQWPMPNPSAEAAAGAPHPPRYTVHADGTVRDEVTGLRWQRTVLGTSDYTWEEAKRHCRELPISSTCGWRLPTRIELLSIVDPSRFNPSIDPVLASETNQMVWTSTASTGQADMAWQWLEGSALFNTGSVSFTDGVRCVSSSPGPVVGRVDRYTLTKETAYDPQTGLTGDRFASPQATWLEAKSHCAALTPSGWRLPTVKELATLADMTRTEVTLDPNIFSGVPGIYWSSTEEAGFNPGQLAHVVNFVDGAIGGEYTGRLAQVRCVRSGP